MYRQKTQRKELIKPMSETTINAAEILHDATAVGASDIFIVAGLPLSYRVNGVLFHKGERLMPDSTEAFIRQIYDLTRSHTIDTFLKNGDDDFSFSIPGLSRFRVSTYKQRGSLAAVIQIPPSLGFPMPSWPFPNTPKAWFSSPARPEAENPRRWPAW